MKVKNLKKIMLDNGWNDDDELIVILKRSINGEQHNNYIFYIDKIEDGSIGKKRTHCINISENFETGKGVDC